MGRFGACTSVHFIARAYNHCRRGRPEKNKKRQESFERFGIPPGPNDLGPNNKKLQEPPNTIIQAHSIANPLVYAISYPNPPPAIPFIPFSRRPRPTLPWPGRHMNARKYQNPILFPRQIPRRYWISKENVPMKKRVGHSAPSTPKIRTGHGQARWQKYSRIEL